MADEHAFTLTFEASGEVTPAYQLEDEQADTDSNTAEPHPEEAEQ